MMADTGKKSDGSGDNGKGKAATRTRDKTRTRELTTKKYEKQLAKLHVELVKLQEWVKAKGLKVCIIFEGRDGAGKGGTIKAITERVSPRVFRVIALPTPTEREKSQMYVQRYLPHLPAAGEVVIWDRSWYNRAGVERVMGFCPEEAVKRFLQLAPAFEKIMIESGIILLKYWLEVSMEEQTRRLEARIDDGRKIWKLSPMDLRIVQPLVRLFAGARRDVQGDRHAVGAVVRGEFRRQEARALEPHHPPAEQDSVQEGAARQGEAAGPAEAARLPRAGLSVQVHPREVLSASRLISADRSKLRCQPSLQRPSSTPSTSSCETGGA